MHVAIGPDQSRDIDAIAADVLHEIAEDREAGDDVEALLCVGGQRWHDQTDEPNLTRIDAEQRQ